MEVHPWEVPIAATWHKSNTLVDFLYDEEGLELIIEEEETQQRWVLRFADPAGFKVLCGEHAEWSIQHVPANGGFFEMKNSPWLSALGITETNEQASAHHYMICCQDELIEIATWECVITQQ